MSTVITMIKTEKLYHHPHNRKNLGDLTELAESIRQNGIYQNLTVVPYDPADHGELNDSENNTNFAPGDVYMVVIGNRRLEGAKIAGLTELPCVISNMDLRGQLRAMAEENMHRKDMTSLEQADNFQLLLDLGDTVEDISQKAGISASTVRNRLKLLELDRGSLVEAEERGGTMRDYMELSKIKNEARRNAVLEKVGTSDFQLELTQALQEQNNAESIEKWIAAAETFAERKPIRDYSCMSYVNSYSTCREYEPMIIPDDKDTVRYMYVVDGDSVTIMKELVVKEKTPEEIAKEQAAAQREEENKQLKKFASMHHELRVKFVTELSPAVAKRHFSDVVAFWGEQLRCQMEREMNYLSICAKNKHLCKAFGIQVAKGQKAPTQEQWQEVAQRCPEYAFFVWVILNEDKPDHQYHYTPWHDVDTDHPYAGSYNEHKLNPKLDAIYDLLCKMGYVMSEQEKQLQEGTHPYLVREKVQTNQAGTDTDSGSGEPDAA